MGLLFNSYSAGTAGKRTKIKPRSVLKSPNLQKSNQDKFMSYHLSMLGSNSLHNTFSKTFVGNSLQTLGKVSKKPIPGFLGANADQLSKLAASSRTAKTNHHTLDNVANQTAEWAPDGAAQGYSFETKHAMKRLDDYIYAPDGWVGPITIDLGNGRVHNLKADGNWHLDAKYLNGTLEEENQRLHREVNLLQLKIELLTDILTEKQTENF